MHPDALHCAVAAEAARKQKRFWQMHDALYSHQRDLSQKAIASLIIQCGLDKRRFDADIQAEAKAMVEEDRRIAEQCKLEGTPSFLLCLPEERVILLPSLDQLSNYIN